MEANLTDHIWTLAELLAYAAAFSRSLLATARASRRTFHRRAEGRGPRRQ